MKQKYDFKESCRFFKPDRPCKYHKMDGLVCSSCDKYSPVNYKILLIKLGALGDVLRTTSICEPLKDVYPDSVFYWITSDEAIDILKNDFIDVVVPKTTASAILNLFKFDLMINLDLEYDALVFAGIAKAKSKKGFWFDSNGKFCFSSPVAKEYFLMSHNDRLKKENKKTYQFFIKKIAELPYFGRIIVPISDSARKNAENFIQRHGLAGKKILGAIAGTGKRWSTKRWPASHFAELFSILKDFEVVIFGGRDEESIVDDIIKKSSRKVINAGCDNSIDYFFGLLNLCDVVITCDTLALHAAVGLGKRTIALFGPTSSSEIEMYGKGKKIVSSVECICCYNNQCSKKPHCMELITPETVAQTIRKICGEE